jgi:hypothetical protein
LALWALATRRGGALVLRKDLGGWGGWPDLQCDCKFGFRWGWRRIEARFCMAEHARPRIGFQFSC